MPVRQVGVLPLQRLPVLNNPLFPASGSNDSDHPGLPRGRPGGASGHQDRRRWLLLRWPSRDPCRLWGGAALRRRCRPTPGLSTRLAEPACTLLTSKPALPQSRLSLPAELENVTRPVFIGVGNKDAMMSVDQTKEASKILAGLREKHVDRSFQVKLYPNVRRICQTWWRAKSLMLTSPDADRLFTAFRSRVT